MLVGAYLEPDGCGFRIEEDPSRETDFRADFVKFYSDGLIEHGDIKISVPDKRGGYLNGLVRGYGSFLGYLRAVSGGTEGPEKAARAGRILEGVPCLALDIEDYGVLEFQIED